MKYLLMIIAVISVKSSTAQSARSEVLRMGNKDNKFIRLTVFNMPSVTVIGYNGTDVIMESFSKAKQSFGTLREINFNPNATGGLLNTPPPRIQDEKNTIFVVLKGDRQRSYVLKVPKNTHLSIIQQVADREGQLIIKNLNNEIEIRSDAALISVDSIAGPLILNADSKAPTANKIIISHLIGSAPGNKYRSPINIISVNHDVELNLDARNSALFNLTTPNGDIYSNLRISPLSSTTAGQYTGCLNKGLTPIHIRSEYGNIYLKNQ